MPPGQPSSGGFPPPGPSSPSGPRVAIPSQRPHGRSRSLPIAVAAGLAIGVFGGLLILRGTGPAAAQDEMVPDDDSDSGEGQKIVKSGKASDGLQNGSKDGADESKDEVESKDGGAVAASSKAPDAGPTETVSAAPDAAPADPPPIAEAKVTFEVSPQPAVEHKDYALLVDDVAVTTGELTVQLEDGKKKIKVVVTSPGFKKYVRRYTIKRDQELAIKLKKVGRGKPSSGPGSLIDL